MRIGILGGRELPTEKAGPTAYALGREIASRDHVLVTGGARGAGGQACRGAHEALQDLGIDPNERIVSYVPEGKRPEHEYGAHDHRGFTWKDRRGLLVLEADFFFVVGGGEGTLDEVRAAHFRRKGLLPLPDTGGLAAAAFQRLADLARGREEALLLACQMGSESPDRLASRVIGLAEGFHEGDNQENPLRSLLERFWEAPVGV